MVSSVLNSISFAQNALKFACAAGLFSPAEAEKYEDIHCLWITEETCG